MSSRGAHPALRVAGIVVLAADSAAVVMSAANWYLLTTSLPGLAVAAFLAVALAGSVGSLHFVLTRPFL